MYTTSIQRGRRVSTDKWIQHRTIDTQRDSQIERKGRQLLIDVHNIKHQIDRERVYSIDQLIENAEIVRQRGRRGKYRQMYTTQNKRQIERQLDREEEGIATDRQMYTTQNNRYIKRKQFYHRTIDRQSYSQIKRKGRKVQIDVYNTEQQIHREIVKFRGR